MVGRMTEGFDVSDQALLKGVLGLLDGVPVERVQALRTNKVRRPTTTFLVSDVRALLDVVEEVWPGLLDHYLGLRPEPKES